MNNLDPTYSVVLQVEAKISRVENKIFASFSKSLGIDDIREVERRYTEHEKEQASQSRTFTIQLHITSTGRLVFGPLSNVH